VDSVTGWVTGSNGLILHTADGGDTWITQDCETDLHLSTVCFINHNFGCAGGKTNWGNSGGLFRTTDGGNSWSQTYSGSAIHSIYFTDTSNGWAVRGIMQSNDGGLTWVNQNNYWHPIGSIFFLDSLNGWTVGSNINGSTGFISSFISSTIDGGENWEEQWVIHSRAGPYLYDIYFTDSLTGYVVGGFPVLSKMIMKSTDGGITWDTCYSDGSGTLQAISFSDESNGWVVGRQGEILHTPDAGISWEYEESGTNQDLSDVHFTENGLGWIAGSSGIILYADHSQTVGFGESKASNTELSVISFPNPFTSSITITYNLSKANRVTLSIYNQLGLLVETLINDFQRQGMHQVNWTPEGHNEGIYVYSLTAGKHHASGRFVFMK
jgi:photosystem II stability/assembly factor-like uncharacterized protein